MSLHMREHLAIISQTPLDVAYLVYIYTSPPFGLIPETPGLRYRTNIDPSRQRYSNYKASEATWAVTGTPGVTA